MALLNQYNPQWFPDPGKGACDNTRGVHGGGGSSSGSSAVDSKSAASAHACFEGDERLRAAAAFAKQKAAAMALLNEHNSDWFGDAGMGEKKAPSLTKRKSLCECIPFAFYQRVNHAQPSFPISSRPKISAGMSCTLAELEQGARLDVEDRFSSAWKMDLLLRQPAGSAYLGGRAAEENGDKCLASGLKGGESFAPTSLAPSFSPSSISTYKQWLIDYWLFSSRTTWCGYIDSDDVSFCTSIVCFFC